MLPSLAAAGAGKLANFGNGHFGGHNSKQRVFGRWSVVPALKQVTVVGL